MQQAQRSLRSIPLSVDHFHPDYRKEPRPSPISQPTPPNLAGINKQPTGWSLSRVLSPWIRERGVDREPPAPPAQDWPSSPYAALRSRLGDGLSGEERKLVAQSMPGWRIHQSGSQIAGQGEPVGHPMLVADGWACRVRQTNARTQITGLILPGDPVFGSELERNGNSDSIWTLTTLHTVDAGELVRLGAQRERFPGIARAMDRLRSVERRHLMNQVARLSETSSIKRVGHLMLEIRGRLWSAGLAATNAFDVPLSRETISDLLALKPQKTDRALNVLRSERKLLWQHSKVQMRDPAGLARLVGFESSLV